MTNSGHITILGRQSVLEQLGLDSSPFTTQLEVENGRMGELWCSNNNSTPRMQTAPAIIGSLLSKLDNKHSRSRKDPHVVKACNRWRVKAEQGWVTASEGSVHVGQRELAVRKVETGGATHNKLPNTLESF